MAIQTAPHEVLNICRSSSAANDLITTDEFMVNNLYLKIFGNNKSLPSTKIYTWLSILLRSNKKNGSE